MRPAMAFFRKKITAVVGGGDVVLSRGSSLRDFVRSMIYRRDEFRGAKSLQKRLMQPKRGNFWDSRRRSVNEKVETLEASQ